MKTTPPLPTLPPLPSLCRTAATTKLPPLRRLRHAAKTACHHRCHHNAADIATAALLPPSYCHAAAKCRSCHAVTKLPSPPLPPPPSRCRNATTPCCCSRHPAAAAAKLSPSRRPSSPTPLHCRRPCRPCPLCCCPHPLFAGWLSHQRLHFSSSPASLSAVVLLATASSSSFLFAGWLSC